MYIMECRAYHVVLFIKGYIYTEVSAMNDCSYLMERASTVHSSTSVTRASNIHNEYLALVIHEKNMPIKLLYLILFQNVPYYCSGTHNYMHYNVCHVAT